MPTMIEIDGIVIDMDDPCAVVGALRAAELKITISGGVVMTRFSEHNEVRWGRAHLDALADLIAGYERLCERKSGRRSRFAKRMRFVGERC
jgi:hypothetical protein